MAKKSLTQLRKQRDNLLKKSAALKLKVQKRSQDSLERQRLEAEIRALRNPKSVKLKGTLKKFKGTKTAAFLKKRGKIIKENLDRMAMGR